MTDDADPILTRRRKLRRVAARRKQFVILGCLLVSVAVAVAVVAWGWKRAQPVAAGAAGDQEKTQPHNKPSGAEGREVVVTGVVTLRTIDIESFWKAADAAFKNEPWSSEPVLVLKRRDGPDAHCFFPRNAHGAIDEATRSPRAILTVAGTAYESRDRTLLVLHNCRLISIDRR